MTMQISDLTNDQLLAVYNRWSTKWVKKFEKRAIGEARLAKLLADLDGMTLEQATAPQDGLPERFAGAVIIPPATDLTDAERDEAVAAINAAPRPFPTFSLPIAGSADEAAANMAEMTEASRMAMPAQAATVPAAETVPVQEEGEVATKVKTKAKGGRIRDRFEAPKPAKIAKVRRAPASIRKDGEVEAMAAGSKGAEVVRLLSRKNGATIAQVMDATGWLAHTTRAYFVALRKRGYPVMLIAKATYRIEEAKAAA